ncbi:MAG: hypothetical protein HUU38_07825 [Anaerolineales bacterium]|nr:hypothetical protein [Anaerolineales bacterium]
MTIQVTQTPTEFKIIDPPTPGARVFGSIFLAFGAVFLTMIAVDILTKASSGNFTPLYRAPVSVFIVLAMAGIPGLLFGFQTNRVHLTPTEVTITKDFVVYKHRKTHPIQEFYKVATRLETVRSQNNNTYRTQRYYDVVLISNQGNLALVRLFEKEYDTARALAKQIANFLHIDSDGDDGAEDLFI